jgi:RHH-type proline utilization regulon transcriptional repressor/proline dehydrogenase/delta 1-pyrroline-5-carboxylate dehydrogenase
MPRPRARVAADRRRARAQGERLDAFLQSYGLGTDEGIALMCLAEALLRVPDPGTADALIHDKLAGIDWGEKLGDSDSTFVNAATFSLMLTGQVLRGGTRDDAGFANALRRAVGRLGEPVIRQATLRRCASSAGQFVFGRTIDEALKRAEPEQKQGLTHSFDMLGEAAMTFADAERYRASYAAAIARLARKRAGGVRASPGISVKLSALYPRYDFLHAEAAKAALVPIVRELALAASQAGHPLHDRRRGGRAARAVARHHRGARRRRQRCSPTAGRASASRCRPTRSARCRCATGSPRSARRHNRRLMVRWSRAPTGTARSSSARSAAHRLPGVHPQGRDRRLVPRLRRQAARGRGRDLPRPSPPTTPTRSARSRRWPAGREFEFQRLHGMGEDVYEVLAEQEGDRQTRVRIYAPVGGHKDLLAYLVRRLLENGANSSFVNRMADADVPVAALVTDPVADLAALEPKRNPSIPLPADIYPNRRNSAGIDLADPSAARRWLAVLGALEAREWHAAPTARADGGARRNEIRSPQDNGRVPACAAMPPLPTST